MLHGALSDVQTVLFCVLVHIAICFSYLKAIVWIDSTRLVSAWIRDALQVSMSLIVVVISFTIAYVVMRVIVSGA